MTLPSPWDLVRACDLPNGSKLVYKAEMLQELKFGVTTVLAEQLWAMRDFHCGPHNSRYITYAAT